MIQEKIKKTYYYVYNKILELKEKECNNCLIKKILISVLLLIFIFTNISPVPESIATTESKIIYPLKKVSKRECRYQEFAQLKKDCIRDLPILQTKDYQKYINQDDGFNDYTRTYSELWGASYKYGWDVGHGGHIGTDIATAKGTPVYSIADGTVIIASSRLGFGNLVSVEHKIKGKVIVSNYGHLSKILVKKGDKVSVGKKIGEVGSTGNSTGNHLHFQIDLDTPFHPYYYDRKACPYSYHQLTEEGVCFHELEKNTVDPLLFLETSGAILDNIKITNVVKKVEIKKDQVPKYIPKNDSSSHEVTKENKKEVKTNEFAIFDKAVYRGSSSDDVKEIQNIFGNLGEYDGPISGNYSDIENAVYKYQLVNNIVSSKTDDGAGYFGPKTRKQTLNDYKRYLKNGGDSDDYEKELKKLEKKSKTKIVVESNIKTKKISRKNILTREEIEAKEVKDFLEKYKIELNFESLNNNVTSGANSTLKLKVTDSRGRLFKGNMPGGMTFSVDESKVSVFPQKLYNFTDGRRDITVTGKNTGSTTLKVKIGAKIVKTFKINVIKGGVTIYPTGGSIYSQNSIVYSDIKTAMVLFKDNIGNNLVNFKYGGTFRLETSGDIQVCIKKGRDLRKTYKKKCNNDFSDTLEFSYADTALGILVFDYKVTGPNAKIKLVNNYKNIELDTKNITVTSPKGLKSNYVYKDEVIDMLKDGVVSGINKGYFQEKKELSYDDASKWIKNALLKVKDESYDNALKAKIDKRIASLDKVELSKFQSISRKDFLDLAYEYLVFNDNGNVSIKYRDLESSDNLKANSIFDTNTTWKDRFGENYYRPKVKLTRGEAAYFLSVAIDKNKSSQFSVR